jgi:peroxiredoxin
MSPAIRNVVIVTASIAALIAGYFTSLWWRTQGLDDNVAEVADFSLTDLDGKERWLSEWNGKTVVLNFWATWCTPCKEEIPLLMAAHARYEDRGVRVVGVAIDTTDAVRAYAKQLKITYPLLVGDEAGLALMARYGNSMGALPYTVILGPDGAILAKKLGAYKKGELESAIDSLASASQTTK